MRVWATADRVADTVSLHVRDTGVGIAAADIDIIFQEFGQVAHRLQGRVKGTGLGLPLAKKLAELLGGNITVESSPGNGSTFSVTLPRVYHVDEPADSDQDWVMETGRIPVLLVEDDPADALAIERLLAGSIYQPLRARTVRAARRVMQSIRPEAILLDILLMGDESWRLLLELRDGEASADIPLIVTSSTDEARKAKHLGADDYLAKPVDGERLIDILDRVTGRHSLTKVLLVDDEEVTHYLVRQLLPRAQYRLWIANDGTDALAQLVESKAGRGLARPEDAANERVRVSRPPAAERLASGGAGDRRDLDSPIRGRARPAAWRIADPAENRSCAGHAGRRHQQRPAGK